MQDDGITDWVKHPSFIICAAMGFYEIIKFFIFLFYEPIYRKSPQFGKMTMTVHNLSFVILCVCLAFGLNKSFRENSQPHKLE